MSSLKIKRQPPAKQIEWVQRRLDRLLRTGCNAEVKGWVIAVAVQGWIADKQDKLNRRGRLRPSDYERLVDPPKKRPPGRPPGPGRRTDGQDPLPEGDQ